MNKELLKRVIAECSDEGIRSNITTKLYGAITEYLEMPEPEPVAWAIFRKGNMYDFSRTQPGEELLGQMGDYAIPVYTTPPDQSARIAQLEKSESFLKDAVDRAIQDTEYYQEQLAALQAKRDPLSDDEIQDIHNELPSRSTYYEFARAIEAAHNIGINHE